MPNCRVSKGTRVLLKTGSFAGEIHKVAEVVEPTGGEYRGCKLYKIVPGGRIGDTIYPARDMIEVVSPKRPEGCKP